MKKIFFLLISLLLSSYSSIYADALALLPSTEGDPDGFIEDCINVINGDYCESVTDLSIVGPDVLQLRRYYNAKNYVTGGHCGGWRIFTTHFLVIGEDPEVKTPADSEKKTLAFTGERSGGILKYSGWRKDNGTTESPLTTDLWRDGYGAVNTYVREINGQTSHKNNRLHCKGNTCEIRLGDGTKRIYEKVAVLPSLIFGEELIPFLSQRVLFAEYYHLVEEILPSNNRILFFYNTEGHLDYVEMVNASKSKTLSWIRFIYELENHECLVKVLTSDENNLEYRFSEMTLADGSRIYSLTHVRGSHMVPCSYHYQIDGTSCALTKTTFPDDSFVEINYDKKGRVATIKNPHPISGQPTIKYRFCYENNYTDVFNPLGVKTRYLYNDYFELIEVAKYDRQDKIYRSDLKFWGTSRENTGQLQATAIADANRVIRTYHSYQYDSQGNVIEECVYGNLSGKEDVALLLDPSGKLINSNKLECYQIKRFYSQDGWNLLTKMGSAENYTLFSYRKDSNLLTKELVVEENKIKKRTFYFYNEDGIRTRVVEDDGGSDEEYNLENVTERHIVAIEPKANLPGVGLPEVIEEQGLNLADNVEISFRRRCNTHDVKGNILFCDTYGADGQHAYTEQNTYTSLGLPSSETNMFGQETLYTYDDCGNQISIYIPHQNLLIDCEYDFNKNLIRQIKNVGDRQRCVTNTFDLLGNKTSSTDEYGNTTFYEYDEFGRIIRVIFPSVYDENETPIQPVIAYAYDIFNHVISITDPNGYVTYKSYNLRGDPTKITYPDGSEEWFKYDLGGRLHRALSRDRILTVYGYDYQGRVIKEQIQACSLSKSSTAIRTVQSKYNAFHCLECTDDYLATKCEYDSIGRPIVIEQGDKCAECFPDSQSRRIEISYDSLGRISCKKVWFDTGPQDYSLECFEYDIGGNLLQKRIEDSSKNVLLRRMFLYDSNNRLIEEHDVVNGQKRLLSKTIYDSIGDSSSHIDASGNQTQLSVDYDYYNALGQNVLRKIITNPLGMQTVVELDALGRISTISKRDSMGILLSRQRIFYDAGGNKCREFNEKISQGKVIGSYSIDWKYGPMGRIEAQIDEGGSPQERQVTCTYNSLGQVIAKTVPGFSNPLTYTYDQAGRLDSVRYSDKEQPPSRLGYLYTYDTRGNIIYARDLDFISVKREYNAYNQLINETITDDHCGNYSISYLYDRKGRIKSIELPDHSFIRYHYNAVFGTEIARVSSDGKQLYSHKYEARDENGRILRELFNDQKIIQHRYDSNGKELELWTPFFVENNTYDAFERLISVKKKGNRSSHKSFTYNDLSQLNSEDGPCHKNYHYDSLDNKLNINDISLIYRGNQLMSHSKTAYTYDPQGNLLRKTLDKEETCFKNNVLSQLLQIQKPDKSIVSFSYDPFGRRLVKKHLKGSGTWAPVLSIQHFLYVGDHEIGCIDEKGNIQELRIPGLDEEGISCKSVAIEIKGKPHISIYDTIGNPAALIDPVSHAIIESYSYSAFGSETVYNSSGKEVAESLVGNPWRYAGKRLDKETGLLFFGHRYYDPEVGRWIQPDPLGSLDGPNLYAYVHNNPVNNIDKFGLSTESKSNESSFNRFFYGDREYWYSCSGEGSERRCVGKSWPRRTVDSSSQLPRIVYCESFENKYPPHMRSGIFDLGLPDYPDIGISFINGMRNSFDEAWESAWYISQLAQGVNVHGVYNRTQGTFLDLVECFMGLCFIATPPVHYLCRQWNDFFAKSSSDAYFLQICTSQGAIHVRNALLDYPPALRERIFVLAIAPGAYVYSQTCKQVVHYRVTPFRDLVPYIDLCGLCREKNTTIVLKSHPQAPAHDHGIKSPTYRKVLRRRIKNYIKTNGKEM